MARRVAYLPLRRSLYLQLSRGRTLLGRGRSTWITAPEAVVLGTWLLLGAVLLFGLLRAAGAI
jgi:hypothetical protein